MGAKSGKEPTYLGVRLRPANEKWCSLRKFEEDQAFTDWSSAWAWITEIDDEVTQRGCAVDLITQQIENLKAEPRSAIKVDKLLNKDWAKVGINKDEKKRSAEGTSTLCQGRKGYLETPHRLPWAD